MSGGEKAGKKGNGRVNQRMIGEAIGQQQRQQATGRNQDRWGRSIGSSTTRASEGRVSGTSGVSSTSPSTALATQQLGPAEEPHITAW